MRENIILTAPVGSSQIVVHNERNRHLQLAEQLAEQRIRQPLNRGPIDGSVALFFREDPTEPKLQLVDLHGGNLRQRPRPVLHAS